MVPRKLQTVIPFLNNLFAPEGTYNSKNGQVWVK